MAMRGKTNFMFVRLTGTNVLLLPVVALISLFAIVACSSSGDDTPDPTATVFVTPSSPATVTPATSTAIPQPTEAPATPTPSGVAPTATTPPTLATTVDATSTPSPVGDEFFLTLLQPEELDIFTSSSTFNIVGQTRVDAVVTVNDDIVAPDSDGIFEHTIVLEEGISIIEVVGSVSTDEQASYVITVVYLP